MPTFFGRSSLDIMWCTIYKRLLAKNNKIDLFSPEVFLTILFMPITRPVQIGDPTEMKKYLCFTCLPSFFRKWEENMVNKLRITLSSWESDEDFTHNEVSALFKLM